MKQNETRCIMCGNKRDGLEVANDYMIGIIRRIKRLTKTEKNYRLIVCRDCFENYRKLRHRYRRRQMECLAIGIIFAAVLIVFNPLRGIVFGACIVFFMYLISQLSWMPALRMPSVPKKAAKTKARKR